MAKKYLNESITRNPNFSFAHRVLSRITRYSKDYPHLAQLKKLYDDTSEKNEINKMNLAFALGKAKEDVKDVEESFSYYKVGNSIHRSKINFSLEKEKSNFDEINFSKIRNKKKGIFGYPFLVLSNDV